MANKAGDESSINLLPTGPPIEAVRGSDKFVTAAIHKLGRKVATLPLDRLLSLNDALILAKGRLGSFSLATHDLTQRASTGQLTVAVRVIWLDGTEEAFLLRPVFWQWFDIQDAPRFLEARPGDERVARVYGRIPLTGWHFFVGRRRFDRLYSTAMPSKPAVQKLPREWLWQEGSQKLTLLSEEPQLEPAPRWRPEQAEEWLKETMHNYSKKPGESKNKWAERLYNDHMKYDFGDKPPWGEWRTLRRYMNPRTRTKKIFDQDS
jgi:hypothetical protein